MPTRTLARASQRYCKPMVLWWVENKTREKNPVVRRAAADWRHRRK